MSAVKIKILETDHGTLVSVDGRAAYDTGNTAAKEKRNIESLLEHLVIENVEIEAKKNG